MHESFSVTAPQVIHAVVTDEEEYGLSLSSPQLPGLSFGRPTPEEFMEDYRQAIWAAYRLTSPDAASDLEVVGHMQRRVTTADGAEAIVRWQTGEGEEERLLVATSTLRLLRSEESAADLIRGLEPSATGEYTFVACLAGDRLGWLLDQLWPTDDALTACLMVAGQMVAMTQVASTGSLAWPSTEDLGWSRDTSLGEVLRSAPADAPVLVRA